MSCAICCEEIEQAVSGQVLLACRHTFHFRCLARWFATQEGESTCPCCRRAVGHLEDLPTDDECGRLEEEEKEFSTDGEGGGDEEDGESDGSEELPVREEMWHRVIEVLPDGTHRARWVVIDAAAEMLEAATIISAAWRGFATRRRLTAQRRSDQWLQRMWDETQQAQQSQASS